MNLYQNKYEYLIGFFLGDFQYLENNYEILEYFKNHRSEIPLCLNDISYILNDNTFEWEAFSNEANIFFKSSDEFKKFSSWLKDELLKL